MRDLVSLRYGFVNGSGAWAIPPRFHDAASFHDGLAAVLLENGWGYVDRQGKVVIPGPVDEAQELDGGVAKVRERGANIERDNVSYVARSGRLIHSAMGHEALDVAVALVLGEGGTADEDQKARDELMRRWEFTLELAPGFPRTIRPEELGLPPGKPLLVAGFCLADADAAPLRDLLRLDLPRVEVRKVRGSTDLRSCPRLTLHDAFTPERLPVTSRLPFDPAWPGYSVELLASAPVEKDGQQWADGAELRLLRGNQVITDEDLLGLYHPDSNDYHLLQPRLVTLGTRAFVLVSVVGSILDRMGTTRERPIPKRKTVAATSLYGYADGKLRELAAFGLHARVEAMGGDWRRLRVDDPDDREHPSDVYRYDEARAEYQPERALKPPPGTPPPLPILFEGCFSERCCIADDVLIGAATLRKEPDPSSPEVGRLPAGAQVEEVRAFSVVRVRPLPVTLDRLGCRGSGLDLSRFDDKRRKAFLLTPTVDRLAAFWLDGEVIFLPACFRVEAEEPPAPESWLRVTGPGGLDGYTRDWEAFPRCGEAGDPSMPE